MLASSRKPTADFATAALHYKAAANREGIGKAGCRTLQSADADITGLRCPHRAACAEAHLRSATAAPAPSRCIRRRRRSTPQPLAGEPSGRQALYKASPARGGGCAARRRRRGALPVCGKNILQGPAGHCPASVGDDARIVPETLRWRKAPAAGEIARPTKPPRAGSNA